MDDPARDISGWLDSTTWTRANRELVAKALTELMYEEVITPDIDDAGQLAVELPGGTLTGRATYRTLGWWRVWPGSLAWTPSGTGSDATTGAGRTPQDVPDAADLVARILARHGVGASTVAGVVAELAATLMSDAWQLARGQAAAKLLDLPPVFVESELRGHPWIIANKGRIGFGADDVLSYGPEAGTDVTLLWLAADPQIADVRNAAGLDHQGVVREQVGEHEFARMRERAAQAGLDPDTCVYLPVHPWQWSHRILALHAGELARRSLVPLGESGARYRPQLAIRTLTDVEHPERRYLKLPLSVLNTSVYRGLPRERALAAPALTEWLAQVVATDGFLQETGIVLLGEVASVSVAHPTYEAVPDVPYQHTEMLGAIWREPVDPYVRAGEQAVSLAALLHVDPEGKPFVQELIRRSGLQANEWASRLHGIVLPPLLHMLYQYGVMFSPHGQNCMLVHRDGVPVRLVVKDFVDDLAICSERLPEHDGIDAHVHDALEDVTIEAKTLVKYLQNGLLICVYRYLAEIMDDALGLPEGNFWASARAELAAYQQRFGAELSDRFALFDLETPTFPKLCLNRLRLFERGYADDPERPVIAAAGEVWNPLARRRDTAPSEEHA
ncbi:IucA/IucC family siderophore biosynthesis protein [Actinobacteria bacterium YIM 96077]|uniref:IucA/IucC family siderophore biosynthesis protein n=1 Tax=Phytoactinopolyspora halophila TaxID=1981511 RepID=A0A329QRL6_9ACTN|nr:IucA/IucC family siderophore biosynthesis protein [Phytoactinopolyspora halophila]AYY14611.1 IucA/IucC family siderophore biosynthesis protein [Actinobacteria bacterium YIM 96077]RAW14012.1 IucA/IucC family siderophore biosynthesis protein [Phytoactinopolyspora halophila]